LEEQAYRQQFELENGHWWFEGRRAVMWALLHRAGVRDGARMLDAGCGTGRNLQEFGRLGPATGVDPSPEAIDFCRQRGIEGVTRGTIEHLEFPDGAFDLILATDVLEHLRDDRAALRELRRVAAPGATLLCTVPAYRWLWSGHDDEHHHFRRYTLRELRAALRAGGWRPLAGSYFNTVLLPPIAAVRLLARRSHRDPDGGRPDLRLTPPALNGLLAQPMRAEAALIGRGLRLPAGVSIGVVARAAESP
jgi:SAM-dependent methyltransferase